MLLVTHGKRDLLADLQNVCLVCTKPCWTKELIWVSTAVSLKWLHILPQWNSVFSLESGDLLNLFSGWEVPHWFATEQTPAGYQPSFRRTNWFEPASKECEMVMNRAGVIDLTSFGKIEVSGPDAHKYMDHICANAVPKVSIL